MLCTCIRVLSSTAEVLHIELYAHINVTAKNVDQKLDIVMPHKLKRWTYRSTPCPVTRQLEYLTLFLLLNLTSFAFSRLLSS